MKKTQLFVCLLALCNLTLFAQTGKAPRISHTTEKSATHVPLQEAPATLKGIYSNLGKKGFYSDTRGWTVSGPASTLASTQFIAMPFTPKTNAHVTQVGVAVQYISGANQVNVSLYGDTSGAPGTLLAGPVTVTNLPANGTCCAVGIANFSPVAVTGLTQYWVVVDTPLTGTGSDFLGAWKFIGTTTFLQGINTGSGWSGFESTPEKAAGEVLGTIP